MTETAERCRAHLQRFVSLLTDDARTPMYWVTMLHGAQDMRIYPNRSVHNAWRELWRDNGEGRSVYLCPNRLHAQAKRHKDESVLEIRALLADQDNGPRIAWPRIPAITVQTSPGRYQTYWLTTGCDVDKVKAFNRRIALTYATDRAVANPATLMRAPGFRNHKHEGSPWVHIIDSGTRDKLAPGGIMNALRCLEADPIKIEPMKRTRDLDSEDKHKIFRECERYLAAIDPPREGERNVTIKEVFFKLGDMGADEAMALDLVRVWETDPLPDEELERLCRGIYRYRKNDIGYLYTGAVSESEPIAVTTEKEDRTMQIFTPTLDNGKLRTHAERGEMFSRYMQGRLIATPAGELYEYSETEKRWEKRSDGWLRVFLFGLGLCAHESDKRALASWVTDLVRKEFNVFEHRSRGVAFRNRFIEFDDEGGIQAREHSMDDYVRDVLAIDYDPRADCPTFRTYLDQWFAGDVDKSDKIEAIARYVGACLAGRGASTQTCLLFKGAGGSGKSTLIDILSLLFSDKAKASLSPYQWGGSQNRFALEALDGPLLNIVHELAVKKFKATDEFKKVTGGNLCSYDIKNKQGIVMFSPICGHIFATNGYPQVDDQTDGFWRRWIIIKFNGSFKSQNNEEATAKIFDGIKGELSGIANMFLRARLRGRGTGLVIPQSHAHELRTWQGVNKIENEKESDTPHHNVRPLYPHSRS